MAANTLPKMKVMLARDYQGEDVKGFYASEKLDGVRAIWDGEKLCTKNFRIINAPDWFISELPKYALDCELWAGRGSFQFAANVVKRNKANDQDWHELRLCIFDLPSTKGNLFQRMEMMKLIVAPHVEILEHIEIKDEKHLNQLFESVKSKGGEGLMLRQPSAEYTYGRTDLLLKMKDHATDEGKCIAIIDGAAHLQWQGIIIKVKAQTIKVGDSVTFKYNGLTENGIPRHARFIFVRDYE